MRKVFSDFQGVFRQNGNIVTQLIIINLIFFFGYALLKFGLGLISDPIISQDLISSNALVNGRFFEFIKQPWSIIFFPFTQDGIFGLIFDLIIIYWFGNMLSDLLGSRKMAITYVIGSLFSLVLFFLVWGIFTRLNPSLAYNDYLYGSSAGTFALMYAYLALNPDGEMMFFTFRIKIRYLILAFLVLSIFRNPALGVLDFGGAVFGYIQMKLLRSGVNITLGIEKILFWYHNRSNRREKVIFTKYPSQKAKAKVINFTSKHSVKSAVDELPSQAEVDYLLDKISTEGYDSLSKEEKERLFKASHSSE